MGYRYFLKKWRYLFCVTFNCLELNLFEMTDLHKEQNRCASPYQCAFGAVLEDGVSKRFHHWFGFCVLFEILLQVVNKLSHRCCCYCCCCWLTILLYSPGTNMKVLCVFLIESICTTLGQVSFGILTIQTLYLQPDLVEESVYTVPAHIHTCNIQL